MIKFKITLFVLFVLIAAAITTLVFSMDSIKELPPKDTTATPAESIAPITTAVRSTSVQATSAETTESETTLPETTAAVNKVKIGDGTLYVLMYHDIIDADASGCNTWQTTAYCLREDIFWLKEHGYTFYLPSEIKNNRDIAEKSVMLTFDDGYDSGYYLLLPILEEYDAKAVISIIVKYTDEYYPSFLTWDMCRELVASGRVEIGSHTYNLHEEGIGRIEGESYEEYVDRVWNDIYLSKTMIQNNLGTECCFFAYPHGETDEWAYSCISQNFFMSVITVFGKGNVKSSTYNMRRMNINPSFRPWYRMPE